MRKCGILTSIILFLPSMLVAQIGGARPAGSDNGIRATIFGGYSYLRNSDNGSNGWEGQGTFNFNRYLGVTADVSGASLSPFSFSMLGFSAGAYQHLNNYLFGPTVTASVGRSAVFAAEQLPLLNRYGVSILTIHEGSMPCVVSVYKTGTKGGTAG